MTIGNKQDVDELFERKEFKFPPKSGASPRRKEEEKPPVVVPRQDPRKPTLRVEPEEEKQKETQKEKIETQKDSAFFDITLPSNFYFYPFKSLSIRTFRAPDQAKCIRAAKEGRFRHLVEAISGTLEKGVSAYDLTHQDFYFLMYWHRMNSFNKSPYVNKTLCESADHLADVLSGKLKENTLEISTIITRSTLTEKQLDPSSIVIPEELAQKYTLDVLRIRDMVEIEEMEDDADFADIEFLADIAAYIKPRDESEKPIKKRIEIVSEMSPDEVEELQTYMRSVTDYGVIETTQVKCKGCGAEKETKVSIDALSFLPTPR